MEYTKDAIISDIQKHYTDGDTLREFSNRVKYSTTTIINRFGSWSNAKYKAGINDGVIICPNCAVAFENISRHWDTCGEPQLTEYQKSLLTGILMSDATVTDGAMTVYNSNLEFLEWLSDELGFMSYSPYLSDLGSERHKRNIKSGFDTDRSANYCDVYTISIPKHSYVEGFNKWYDDQKRIPEIDLDSVICKMWYCGDGGLNWDNIDTRAYAEIRCVSESDRDNFIESLFKNTPISPKCVNGNIRFYGETKEFLDWIGEPPDGMEYKWEINDRERYNELKQ